MSRIFHKLSHSCHKRLYTPDFLYGVFFFFGRLGIWGVIFLVALCPTLDFNLKQSFSLVWSQWLASLWYLVDTKLFVKLCLDEYHILMQIFLCLLIYALVTEHLLYSMNCFIFNPSPSFLLRNSWYTSLYKLKGFPGSPDGKESACNVGDLASVPGLRRSSGGAHGNPLQYSCLENPMDKGAWRATVHGITKSHSWVTTEHTQSHTQQFKNSILMELRF